jgi:hypothetical protein
MQFWLINLAVALTVLSGATWADSYRVSTLRAAPGQLELLLDELKDYRKAKRGQVLLMRHSQGDHWDVMLLEPAGADPGKLQDFGELADFQLSFLAQSETSLRQIQASAESAGLFHIEMFHARAGKKAELIDQRVRENQYLERTGQVSNSVFVTQFGSDVDVFTLGFHSSMAALDRGPTVSDTKAEEIAKEAGFKNRADLGYYLRSLLVRHHDTLAVPVDR